ncbi:hypothetical protein [Nocardioides sp. YIM 152315]|uniref:hypothetical protein n=1 Tax=Nocardioides sp. YIM 152315 TaxID=3031760 RepID=UPI0023DA4F84|nr:hypothetical protein [Nocardioides sp. YIM 152315]MDF1605535.1 hypothetical protein [Nocardioides sp. YIM 152315]
MLTLTDAARDVIRMIPEQAQYADTAGLRIRRPAGADSGFTVKPADAPGADERAVELDGARLFLGPEAAESLRDARLDAQFDAFGRVHFHSTAGSR